MLIKNLFRGRLYTIKHCKDYMGIVHRPTQKCCYGTDEYINIDRCLLWRQSKRKACNDGVTFLVYSKHDNFR